MGCSMLDETRKVIFCLRNTLSATSRLVGYAIYTVTCLPLNVDWAAFCSFNYAWCRRSITDAAIGCISEFT
jgi:hypothetical protein